MSPRLSLYCARLNNEEEWSFLRNAALDKYNNEMITLGAINTLKLIATPRSVQILDEVRKTDSGHSSMIGNAIAYAQSNPGPLVDRDLVKLGERVALATAADLWKGNKSPTFNSLNDRALIDIEYGGGMDLVVATATFQKVGEFWKFCGARDTMSALIVGTGSPEPR